MAGMASEGSVVCGGNGDGHKVMEDKKMVEVSYMGLCGLLLVCEGISVNVVQNGENPKKLEIEAAKQEVISTDGVGLLLVDKKDAKFIKSAAKDDERGTVFIGVGVGLVPKSVEYPKRHGGPLLVGPPGSGNLAGWEDLSEELKDKVNECVIARVTNEHQGSDLKEGFAWAFTSTKNYSELIPMLYQNVKVCFRVVDCQFGEVIHFMTSIHPAAAHALLKNNNLHILIVFTNDNLEDYILKGTKTWLNACKYMTRKLQMKPFNGVRVPWIYHARAEDMFAHLEWEGVVVRWPEQFAEWDQEIELMKDCFQQAPVS